jgi:hypothetical protein
MSEHDDDRQPEDISDESSEPEGRDEHADDRPAEPMSGDDDEDDEPVSPVYPSGIATLRLSARRLTSGEAAGRGFASRRHSMRD